MPRSPITVKAPSCTGFSGGLFHTTGLTLATEPGCSPGVTSNEPWHPSTDFREQARRLPRGGMFGCSWGAPPALREAHEF